MHEQNLSQEDPLEWAQRVLEAEPKESRNSDFILTIARVAVCVVVPILVWTVIARSYVASVNKKVVKQDHKLLVKPLEFKPFDVDGFRRGMGIVDKPINNNNSRRRPK